MVYGGIVYYCKLPTILECRHQRPFLIWLVDALINFYDYLIVLPCSSHGNCVHNRKLEKSQ